MGGEGEREDAEKLEKQTVLCRSPSESEKDTERKEIGKKIDR